MLRVQSVMLVPPENRAYRDHCRHMKLLHRPLGRPNGFTPMQRLPYVLEAAARAWLSGSVPLMPQRILSYEVFERGRWRRRYREIDAVAGTAGKATALFEVKVGHGTYERAYKQLRTSAEVLSAAGKGGQTLAVVLVRYDDDDTPLEKPPADVWMVDDVARLSTVQGDCLRPLLILSARALWEHALACGQVDDPSLWDAARAEYFSTRGGDGIVDGDPASRRSQASQSTWATTPVTVPAVA